MTTRHTQLVLELLDADPLGAHAEQLRTAIAAEESQDATLFKDRVVLFAAHALRVGEQPPAKRQPAGKMLT